MLNRVKEKIRGFLFLPKYIKVKQKFSLEQAPNIEFKDKPVIMESKDLIGSFVYKDENWNYIKNRFEYRMSIKAGSPVSYNDNECVGGG